jgi:hypothetical protein
MAKITDTSKRPALHNLFDAVDAQARTGDPSNAILEQEARGQEEFVAAAGSQLPAQGTIDEPSQVSNGEMSLAAIWKAHGIKIGEPVKGDEIWVNAELPPGWKIEATDHSMWSNLVDHKGNSRAAIFYKAAFYDRECFIRPERRYSATMTHDRNPGAPRYGLVMDGSKEIERIGPFFDDEGERPPGHSPEARAWKTAYEKAQPAARAWLDEHRPQWNDFLAYWNR